MLRKPPTYGINGRFGSQRKSLILILLRQIQNFVWVYIIVLIIIIWLLMENKSLNLKLTIKIVNFQLTFVSEVFLMDLIVLSLEKYL